MLLPIWAFLLTWLKLWVGIPAALALGYGFYQILKSDHYAGKTIYLDTKCLVGLVVGICLWCWLAGQGGWFFQTLDNHWRNAVFRDMITHDWPVFYQVDGSALVYYLMQWILPALVGKVFGWTVANMALFAWDALGILLALIGLLFCLKTADTKKCMLVLLLFISWSGLHLIACGMGTVLYNKTFQSVATLDGWSGSFIEHAYQYSTNTTLLQWVYNQTIVPWLATAMLVMVPHVEVFMFLGFCVLPYGPLPFVGLVFLMLGVGVAELIRCSRASCPKRFFAKAFSIPNVMALITLFPIFAAYYGCNSAAIGADGRGGFGWYIPPENVDARRVFVYLLFLLVEFGIYSLLIGRDSKQEPLFIAAVWSLSLIPLFRVGTSVDFCMRASIPGLMIILFYVIRYLFDNKKLSARMVALIICLTIGAWSGFGGLGNAVRQVIKAGTIFLPADDIGTVENYQLGLMEDKLDTLPDRTINFCCFAPREQFFFKYFADMKNYPEKPR